MSPKYYKIPLNEAQRIWEEIRSLLQDLTTRIEVAGSIRRRRPVVHDLDIVLIPELFAFPARIILKLRERWPDLVINKQGKKLVSLTLYQGVSVDLYASEPRYFGTHLLRWTGSTEHNIMMCRRAQTLGLKLAVSRGVERDGQVIASETEMDIFKALKMDFVAPEDREV